MNIGHVKFIQPNHPTTKKWIKGYYIHSSPDPDFYTRLTFFQNITTTISIYRDSSTTSEGRLRRQQHQVGSGFSALLVGLVDKYQEVEFYGPLDRLAIVFFPGGINQFIRPPLGTYLKKHYAHFHYFDEAFKTFLPIVYQEDALDKKRDLLDAFLMQHYQILPEPQLMKSIDLLINAEEVIKVGEVAERLALSRRTLLRKFRKHLGYSPEEYIQVIKFRKALLNFQRSRGMTKLTDIALDSNYYDQADFNHQIKFRSDLTPKELFRQLEIVDDTLFWKL